MFFLTQYAVSGHSVTVHVVTRTGLGAVDSVLAKPTGEIATAEEKGKEREKSEQKETNELRLWNTNGAVEIVMWNMNL